MSINGVMQTALSKCDALRIAKRLEREGREVSIIADKEKFYVESPVSLLVRPWERLVYVTNERPVQPDSQEA